jgi:hypothetical protein
MQLSVIRVLMYYIRVALVNSRFDNISFIEPECYAVKDFVCLNHRCISSDLRCDGFNHCGDDSDEQTSCGEKGFFERDIVGLLIPI